MKKAILFIMTIVLAAGLLTACSSNKDQKMDDMKNMPSSTKNDDMKDMPGMDDGTMKMDDKK